MKRAAILIAVLAIVPVLLHPAQVAQLKVRVVVQTANLRNGPDMTAAVVQTAKVGAVFPVIRKTGDWYLVGLAGTGQAYIHRTVVEEVTEAAAAPAQPAAPQPKPAAPQPKPAAPAATPPTAPPVVQRPSPPPAGSSGAAEPKLYVRLNYGLGFQEESKTLSFDRTVYYETASYGLDYTLKKGGSFDGAVGYMLSPSIGAEIGASMTSRDMTESLTLSVPHPLWMGYPREGTIDGSGLKLSEIDLYLNLVYSLRFSMFGVSLYGGPCFMMASATIVTDVTTEETGYPYMELNATQTSAQVKKNVFGFDAGAALSVYLGRSFAVLLDARYVSGKGAFKPEGDIPELALTLGGFRVGGGLKLRF
jgi:hypothetical protein